MGEPVKLSFGFSKVATKKPPLVASKPLETVEYIKCVEDNAVKLVNETIIKPKELPVIPMPTGSSVRDRILEAIKAREEARGGKKKEESSDEKLEPLSENGNVETKPLTLDEMAAKELLEGATAETEEKKEAPVIAAGEDATRKESTLDDYENMPINDFGLAMLRGMGWNPSKGIGLNEKVVTPVAPQLRPKGMGLGADKALAAQTKPSKSTEELIMKKGSMVKVITGPYIHLYGIVEGFEELPGRILVRLTLSNASVSLSEFMVQLVGPTEYNKNAKVMNLDKYNAALDSEAKPFVDTTVKSEAKPHESKSFQREAPRRSRSPRNKYSGKSKNGRSTSRRDRSKDRSRSRKEKYRDPSSGSDSDSKFRKKSATTDRRSKKGKYSSESSDSDYSEKKRSESSRDRHRSKHSKHKKHKKDRK